MNKTLVLERLKRLTKFVDIEAPEFLIKVNIEQLNRGVFGSRIKACKFMLGRWWIYSKLNPVSHYRIWRAGEEIKKEFVKDGLKKLGESDWNGNNI